MPLRRADGVLLLLINQQSDISSLFPRKGFFYVYTVRGVLSLTVPVYRLISSEPLFPDPEDANEDGLLAIGGALTEDWLLSAYQNGIFPWFSEGDPVMWWSPDPRFVLYPGEVYISKTMRSKLRSPRWSFTMDLNFDTVLDKCAEAPREGQDGTWITSEMRAAYKRLHRIGIAHSAEARLDGVLVGGLYGVSIGAAFFGESMYTEVSDASKFALINLCKYLESKQFKMVDCQIYSAHLEQMGAEIMPRTRFLELLDETMESETQRGNWK